MKKITIFLIDLYKALLSPFLTFLFGKGCRYMPTCSVYAKQAISGYGILRGGTLSIKRIAKCHPFSEGRFDPIPKSLN